MALKSVEKCEFMKLASIVPASTEDYSDVRELHKSAISSVGWRFYSLAEVAAKLEAIDQPEYTADLLKENVQLAKFGHVLIGSSSWRPSNEHMQTATITHLYVNPLFSNGGVATALIEESEQLAYKSGFRWISALSDFNSRSFFSRLGYEAQGFRGCKITKTTQYPLQIMTRHIASQYAKQKTKIRTSLMGTQIVHE